MITYDKAISLYPKATFKERYNQYVLYNSTRGLKGVEDALAKYGSRGWPYRSRYNEVSARASLKIDQHRYVGDSACWVVNLNTDGVQLRTKLTPTSPIFTWDPVMENSWRMEGDGLYLYMKMCVVSMSLFRYCYTISHRDQLRMLENLYVDLGYYEDCTKAQDENHLTWSVGLLTII